MLFNARRFCLLLCLLCCFCGCKKDVLHWQSVQSLNADESLQFNNGLKLRSGALLVCGGTRFGRGDILISADMGKTWQRQNAPEESKGFFGISESRDGQVFLGGLGLNICASRDLFATQNFGRVAGRYDFSNALSVPQGDTGFLVTAATTDTGGIVRFTADLKLIDYTFLKAGMQDIFMFDNRTGFAAGSGKIVKTTDGGAHWTTLSAKGDNFTCLAAVTKDLIYAAGLAGYIFKTEDGGATWKRLRNGSNIANAVYAIWDIFFLNEQEGFAVGEKGLCIFTRDGGEHWSEFERFTQKHLRFITDAGDGRLLAGGENGALFLLQPEFRR